MSYQEKTEVESMTCISGFTSEREKIRAFAEAGTYRIYEIKAELETEKFKRDHDGQATDLCSIVGV